MTHSTVVISRALCPALRVKKVSVQAGHWFDLLECRHFCLLIDPSYKGFCVRTFWHLGGPSSPSAVRGQKVRVRSSWCYIKTSTKLNIYTPFNIQYLVQQNSSQFNTLQITPVTPVTPLQTGVTGVKILFFTFCFILLTPLCCHSTHSTLDRSDQSAPVTPLQQEWLEWKYNFYNFCYSSF